MRNDVVDHTLAMPSMTNRTVVSDARHGSPQIAVLATDEDRVLRAYLNAEGAVAGFARHETTLNVVRDAPHAVIVQLDCPEDIWLSSLLRLRCDLSDVPIIARTMGAAFDSLLVLASLGVRGHLYDVSSRWRHVQAVRIVATGGMAWSPCDLRKTLFVLETDGFLPALRRIRKLVGNSLDKSGVISATDDVAAIAKEMLRTAVTPPQRTAILDWQTYIASSLPQLGKTQFG